MNKKLIIFLIIALIIVSIVLVIILNNIKNKNNAEKDPVLMATEKTGGMMVDYYAKEENGGINREAYYDVQECIHEYLDIININNELYFNTNENGNKVRAIDEDYIKSMLYDVISEKYIISNNISVDNIFDKIKTINTKYVFIPLEAKVIQDGDISSFLVHGLLEEADSYKLMDNVFYIVNIDVENKLYSIEPIYGNYNSINDIQIIDTVKNIKENDNNKYRNIIVDYKVVANDYINIYKRLALGAPETIYSLLDKEYKEKRFGSLDNFKEYINKNRNEIAAIVAESYLVNNGKDNFSEFVIKDQYGNLYIFDQKAILNYTVKLDTYTLEQDKFNSTYKTATNKNKVMMNIDKFFQMINNNDYTSSYKVLNSNFKSLNFKTEESFENYMRQNIYTHADITYVKFSDEISGVYTYYIELTDKTKKNDNKIKMNIVMQLLEGTDYQLSFEILK